MLLFSVPGCKKVELVGNGFCNDETNIVNCHYDGGDCCTNLNLTGNSICNDETNVAGCNFDGGDCCVNINTDYCSECNCLGSGVITTPGYPGYYENNLDLTWLIQVQSGQLIQIHFEHFDIEVDSSCRQVENHFFYQLT